MLVPQGGIQLNTVESITFANYTYRLKIADKRIDGMVDGTDALVQALYKILQTERYAYAIYSHTYGAELEDLIGKDKNYVKSELPRRIEEALLMDDRIDSVSNFTMIDSEESSDAIHVTFEVMSAEGIIEMNTEVTFI